MNKMIAILVLVVLVLAAVIYLKRSGVTHEDIHAAVVGESAKIRASADERYRALDTKLDRIERKLDRLLEIADRPLPDGMRPAQ